MSLKSSLNTSSNTNDIFDSLTKSISSDTNASLSGINSGVISSNSNASPSSKGLFSFFENISWTTWILIIIVLAILGFNVFAYLAKGTQFTANLLGEGSSWVSSLVGPTAKQTVDVSASGAKAGIDVAASGATAAINAATGTFQPNVATSSQPGQTVGTELVQDKTPENALSKSLNDASQSNHVEADDSYSSIQMTKSSSKSGWCYIGEEKGVRSCVSVGVNDMCMSGDIFPTNEVCVNPNLRV